MLWIARYRRPGSDFSQSQDIEAKDREEALEKGERLAKRRGAQLEEVERGNDDDEE
jgi:NaMN:DMB phosphoribosyltransferase